MSENKCKGNYGIVQNIIYIKSSDLKIENGMPKLKRKYGKFKREVISVKFNKNT